MKNSIKSILFISLISVISSCEKDEGKLPNISFKSGSAYTSADATLPKGSSLLIGIDASKSEDKDYLKSFNISKSVDGASATTVYNKDLADGEKNDFSYDFSSVLENVVGQKNKYTFTITNRDGLTNQVSLTVTIQ